ncbi:hypothetical protein ABDB91_01695 [Desulfoscipio sp. XC116]|uniref:hypothetical protein n=1 Tax=Desulfoscipio sp. XC116 TaxID=3144975 RepID=UPI00325B477B
MPVRLYYTIATGERGRPFAVIGKQPLVDSLSTPVLAASMPILFLWKSPLSCLLRIGRKMSFFTGQVTWRDIIMIGKLSIVRSKSLIATLETVRISMW